MAYFFCYKEGEHIYDKEASCIEPIFTDIVVAYKDISYLKKDHKNVEKQSKEVYGNIFLDIVFFELGKKLFNTAQGKIVRPFKLISKILNSDIHFKTKLERIESEPEQIKNMDRVTLIDLGFHGNAQQSRVETDEVSKEDEMETVEEHVVENVVTNTDKEEIGANNKINSNIINSETNQTSQAVSSNNQSSINEGFSRDKKEIGKKVDQMGQNSIAANNTATQYQNESSQNSNHLDRGTTALKKEHGEVVDRKKGMRNKIGRESVRSWEKESRKDPTSVGLSYAGVGFNLQVDSRSKSQRNSGADTGSEERESTNDVSVNNSTNSSDDQETTIQESKEIKDLQSSKEDVSMKKEHSNNESSTSEDMSEEGVTSNSGTTAVHQMRPIIRVKQAKRFRNR